jgi:hypothetical protein
VLLKQVKWIGAVTNALWGGLALQPSPNEALQLDIITGA